MLRSTYQLLTLCLLLFQFSESKAQQYFSSVVDEQSLPMEARVSAQLRSTYSTIRYARETSFMPSQNFTLKLPDNTSLEIANVRWYEMTNGSVSYSGKIVEQPRSDVAFALYLDRWFGMVVDESGKKYIFHQTADDIFAISTIEESSLIARDGTANDFTPVNDPEAVPVYNICAVDNPCDANNVVINLMVGFTDLASDAYGSDASMIAAITTAVTNMNIANTNSGVRAGIVFNLIHTENIIYTEAGNTGTDLSRLATNGDGYMDNIHTLRDTYAADLVSLIVGIDNSGCGIGYLNTSNVNYNPTAAFNVTLVDCLVGNYTMAHEFGHNMGLQHDYYVAASTQPCAHHHGYVNQATFNVGAPANSRWRTILAYNNECSTRGGFNCTRLNYWSNPDITYFGDPMGRNIGVAQPANEAYAMNRFACQVASFRGNAVLPLNFIYANAAIRNDAIAVNWKTENEIRIDYFEIEVATELPRNFISVQQVNAKNEQQNIYHQNIFLPSAKNIFIRIKSVGENGEKKYGPIIHLSNNDYGFARLLSNLVQQKLDLIINENTESNTQIEIIDMKGLSVKNTKQIIPANTSAHQIQVGHLQSGHYILRITNARQKQTIRFFKQ